MRAAALRAGVVLPESVAISHCVRQPYDNSDCHCDAYCNTNVHSDKVGNEDLLIHTLSHIVSVHVVPLSSWQVGSVR